MSAKRQGLHGGGYTELEGGGVFANCIGPDEDDDPPPFPSSACGLVQPQGLGWTKRRKSFPLVVP